MIAENGKKIIIPKSFLILKDEELNSSNVKKRFEAVDYASREAVIKRASFEKVSYVIIAILKRLEREKITKKEAAELSGARAWHARKFAVAYLSKKEILKMAMVESNSSGIKAILKKLESLKLTKGDFEELSKCEREGIRNFALTHLK